MEIKIAPVEKSSLKKEIVFELGKYTIFAGENNAGKTNLMKALLGSLPPERTIFIPAEKISAPDALKTTAKEDPMRAAFLKLIDITFKELPNINYEKVGHFLENISDTFDSFGVKNISLKLEVKELGESDIKKAIKDEVSKKILESVVEDAYGAGCDLKIGDVGQGTQRLIIAAILKELSKVGVQEEELFLIFEEPEIYLHPKLKRSLNIALLEISKSNINVIVTTHDPYFIELGVDQKIYNVVRDTDGATAVKSPLNGVLEMPTHAEINYVIFDVPSTDYFLQLYQKADENGVKDLKTKTIDGITLFDIRGSLAHRTEKKNVRSGGAKQPVVTEDIKKKAIDHLRSLF